MSAYENWKVELALHSQPDDPFPVYDTDLTGYVDGVLSAGHGRPSELQSVEAGTLGLVLNNADHRFTFGNTGSPYYPYWKQARKLRVRETIGYRSFTVFTGYLELPDITDWAESGDQLITVTAVDRLTRLDRARKFISTLAEYVLYNGGSALKGFWPLADAAGSTQGAEFAGAGLGPLVIEGQYLGDPAAAAAASLISFGQVAGPSGDDGTYVQFNPALNVASTAVATKNRLAVRDLGALSMISNAFVTVAGWCKLDKTNTGGYQVLLAKDNVSTNSLQIGTAIATGTGNIWQLIAANVAGIATVNGSEVTWGAWQFVAARINNATGAVDFWVDGHSFTGSCGGASNGTLDALIVDNGSPGQAAGIVQLYAGASTDFDRTRFDAQRAMAGTGLQYQTTGQRIRTVAAYAGIPTGELNIDDGVAYMRKASLAGRSPLEPMREAETTERGVLLADGSGELVFQDRIRRYNL